MVVVKRRGGTYKDGKSFMERLNIMCEWGAFVQGIADYSRVLTVNAHTLEKRTPRMNATWHEFIFL